MACASFSAFLQGLPLGSRSILYSNGTPRSARCCGTVLTGPLGCGPAIGKSHVSCWPFVPCTRIRGAMVSIVMVAHKTLAHHTFLPLFNVSTSTWMRLRTVEGGCPLAPRFGKSNLEMGTSKLLILQWLLMPVRTASVGGWFTSDGPMENPLTVTTSRSGGTALLGGDESISHVMSWSLAVGPITLFRISRLGELRYLSLLLAPMYRPIGM